MADVNPTLLLVALNISERIIADVSIICKKDDEVTSLCY